MMKTLEQQYAAAIYLKVDAFGQAHPGEDNKDRKRYGVMAQKLPVLVRQAGLAQALAFVDAKATGANKEAYSQLLKDLAEVLREEDLLKKSREDEMPSYTRLTRHTLLALTWFKRFSQSILGVDLTEGDD
ncbi:MAG: type III-B CRISPR module-associated protein Cmr5 [Chloroflexota bacterium]